ncbi:MAG: polymerase sigma-32 factor, partial [Pseudomonadota bacterium]|nr:polymerase sigma-32 factor [Pseudomonadota bacterium]
GSEALTPGQTLEVAQKLGVKPEEVTEMETRLSGRDLAMESSDDEDEKYAPIAWLADSHSEPTQVLEAREYDRLQSDGLRIALEGLDARSRRIIEARWLAEGDAATLHELADEFSVSAERIRQIEAKALQKMKGLLSA